MIHKIFILIFIVSSFNLFNLACASEIKELIAVNPNGKKIDWLGQLGKDVRNEGNFFDRVLCVDGVKIFQTIAFSKRSTGGSSIFSIQLNEEKNGKIVPMSCDTK